MRILTRRQGVFQGFNISHLLFSKTQTLKSPTSKKIIFYKTIKSSIMTMITPKETIIGEICPRCGILSSKPLSHPFLPLSSIMCEECQISFDSWSPAELGDSEVTTLFEPEASELLDYDSRSSIEAPQPEGYVWIGDQKPQIRDVAASAMLSPIVSYMVSTKLDNAPQQPEYYGQREQTEELEEIPPRKVMLGPSRICVLRIVRLENGEYAWSIRGNKCTTDITEVVYAMFMICINTLDPEFIAQALDAPSGELQDVIFDELCADLQNQIHHTANEHLKDRSQCYTRLLEEVERNRKLSAEGSEARPISSKLITAVGSALLQSPRLEATFQQRVQLIRWILHEDHSIPESKLIIDDELISAARNVIFRLYELLMVYRQSPNECQEDIPQLEELCLRAVGPAGSEKTAEEWWRDPTEILSFEDDDALWGFDEDYDDPATYSVDYSTARHDSRIVKSAIADEGEVEKEEDAVDVIEDQMVFDDDSADEDALNADDQQMGGIEYSSLGSEDEVEVVVVPDKC